MWVNNDFKKILYLQLILIFGTGKVFALDIHQPDNSVEFIETKNMTSNGTAFTSIFDLSYDDEVAPQALAFINSIREVIFVNGFD